MLDADHAVVALAFQHADERLPELVAVAVAAGAEDPASGVEVGIALGVEGAVDARVVRVDAGILAVDVEDALGIAEHAGRLDGVMCVTMEEGDDLARCDDGVPVVG